MITAYRKKKTKHIQTAGTRRNSNVPSAAACLPLACCGAAAGRSSLLRLATSTASTMKASVPAPISATRQEKAMARGTTTTGASAQPRLPVMPWKL